MAGALGLEGWCPAVVGVAGQEVACLLEFAATVGQSVSESVSKVWEIPESLQNRVSNSPLYPFILSSVFCQSLPLAKLS